jgi:hypothetical protein
MNRYRDADQYRILNHRQLLVFTEHSISLFDLPHRTSSVDTPHDIESC